MRSKTAELLSKSTVHTLLIAAVGILVYSNTFYAPFHFDDQPGIVRNEVIRNLANFWPPFGSRWAGTLTFALNYYFDGLNVTGYHLVNICIHIMNALLVYAILTLTFQTHFFKDSAINDKDRHGNRFSFFALFSALIFVSHPIQTQAVTYIIQRYTSLATLFYLCSLVLYILARLALEHGGQLHERWKIYFNAGFYYIASIISAILAMMTKEISFTLPVVILLYELMFFKKDSKRLLFVSPLLLAIVLIPFGLMLYQGSGVDLAATADRATRLQTSMPRTTYLFTQFRVIATYLRLLIFPVNQIFDYNYPIYNSLSDPNVYLSLALILMIIILAGYLYYRSRSGHNEPFRLISFGILWFFITISVESSVFPIIDVIFEHRLYLPSIGLFTAITMTLFMPGNKEKNIWPQVPKLIISMLALTIVALSAAAYSRNIVWGDRVSLWEDVTSKAYGNGRGHLNLGDAYSETGRLGQAIIEYKLALSLPFRSLETQKIYNNLGYAYKKIGSLDEAIDNFKTALRFDSGFMEAQLNLGYTYLDSNRIDEAIIQFQHLCRLQPYVPEHHLYLGLANSKKGLLKKAMDHYGRALNLNPNNAAVYNQIGILLAESGQTDQAVLKFQKAVALNPGFAEAHYNLFLAYTDKKLFEKAREHFNLAERLKPDIAK